MHAKIKRTALRSLLTIHFIGLALMIGGTVASLVVNQLTGENSLQTLAFGRDLGGAIIKAVVLPGFLIIVATGGAMTLLRYGRRPPLWVWIKVALNLIALAVAAPFVAPALNAARQWAHWSVDHNQLAPEFQQSSAQAAFFGAIIFSLLLLNIPVAVWKPLRPARPTSGKPPAGPERNWAPELPSSRPAPRVQANADWSTRIWRKATLGNHGVSRNAREI